MFGKAGLGGLMKQAQQMQENMKKAQAKLAETEVEGEAGNGLVKVVMTCAHVVRKLEISPDLIQEAADDKEMLEDLVLAAINAASEKSRRNHQQNHGCIHPRPARRHGRLLPLNPRRKSKQRSSETLKSSFRRPSDYRFDKSIPVQYFQTTPARFGKI